MPTVDYCLIDSSSRIISISAENKLAGVESDKNVQHLKFKCPKIVGNNIDLSSMVLRINFINAKGTKDQYIVEDLEIVQEDDKEYITFTWKFSENVTYSKGSVRFIVCAISTDTEGIIKTEWNTTIAELKVLEGLEVVTPEPSPEEKDVIAQLISICQSSANAAELSAQQAQEEAEKVLNYGPKIGANGNWIVGGEDTGQPSRGEAGPKGDPGDAGEKGDPGKPGANGETPIIGDNSNWFIGGVDTGKPSRGEKGDKGDEGDPGKPGATPEIGDNGNWYVNEVDTGKPSKGPSGELLLAEYIHQGNQEIYFSSFDWSTGIGECTEPHGLTKKLISIIIVPNNWWLEDVNNDIGLSIPFEWCLYNKVVCVSTVDETHLKVVGEDSMAIQVNPDDQLNAKLDCTKFHFEIGVPFEISNFPAKPTNIRMTMSGFFRNKYRYISPGIVMQDGSKKYINNMLLNAQAFGSMSKPNNALYQVFDMTTELNGSWYVVFKLDNKILGRRASGAYNMVFGEETREQQLLVYKTSNREMDNGMYQYISALRTLGNVPAHANYSNHTVVRVYAKAVTQ